MESQNKSTHYGQDMDLTVITPTTNHPNLPKAMDSVGLQGLSHIVVWDGVQFPFPSSLPEYEKTKHIVLPFNTGRNQITGKVAYYGHRIYSAMTFLLNTKWVMFLDEDNTITADFAESIAQAIEHFNLAPAITFRRNIVTDTGEFIGLDDFESIPEHFADTGTVIWNTKYFARHIAADSFDAMHGNDRKCHSLLVAKNTQPIPHIKQYLLNYTTPPKNEGLFRAMCTNHVGGYIPDGDYNTFFPDVWGALCAKADIKSVVDVGCGSGHNLLWFATKGIETLGIDGHPDAVKLTQDKHINAMLHDYAKSPLSISSFDLALCTEFAEHVHAEYEDNWLETLSSCKYVLFSHALVGQGGYHHVNEQPTEYWIERFAKRGFVVDEEFTATHRDTSYQWGKNTLTLFVKQ
jgi:2-polyprenyl-3-methyl-5-hydroxy-6-metoxy-1,4-benzoquinol methylase